MQQQCVMRMARRLSRESRRDRLPFEPRKTENPLIERVCYMKEMARCYSFSI